MYSICDHWRGAAASQNIPTRQSAKKFKQVPKNWRLNSSVTPGCFKSRHEKESYCLDWLYNGFHQPGGYNGFPCQLAIRSLSVSRARCGVLHTFAGGSLHLLWGTILNWLRKHSRNWEKHISNYCGRKPNNLTWSFIFTLHGCHYLDFLLCSICAANTSCSPNSPWKK